MKFLIVGLSLLASLLLLAYGLKGQEVEVVQKTSWLNTLEGSTSYKLGAEVLSVNSDEVVTTIDVGFPENVLKDFKFAFAEDRMTKKVIAQTHVPSLLKDLEDRPYGLRFKLKRLPGFEFRVHLYERIDAQE
tara:strand:- start:194 stop:589 length:396 start_codon:yes stop_codon:yes gene_type:complete